jgi:hypothetical protein
LYRYTKAAKKFTSNVAALVMDSAGLYKLTHSLTHSLKEPGFH